MKVTEPGVYTMDAETYHADPCPAPSLSSSGARKLLKHCPARYWYDRQNPPEPSGAFVLGSAAHEWLLEGETWPQRHVVLPEDHDNRTKDGRARVEAIKAAGKRPVTADQWTAIRDMKAALDAHPFAGAAFRNGRPELSLFWRDDRFGIWCRARPDWLPNAGTIVADYKTCVSAHPDDLRKAIANHGYDQQADWYMRGIKALGLMTHPTFVFVFQEKAPPYLVTVVTLEEAALLAGGMKNERAAAIFAKCLRTGQWPGYADDVVCLDLPEWEHKQIDRDKERGLYDVMNEWQAPHQEAAE